MIKKRVKLLESAVKARSPVQKPTAADLADFCQRFGLECPEPRPGETTRELIDRLPRATKKAGFEMAQAVARENCK